MIILQTAAPRTPVPTDADTSGGTSDAKKNSGFAAIVADKKHAKLPGNQFDSDPTMFDTDEDIAVNVPTDRTDKEEADLTFSSVALPEKKLTKGFGGAETIVTNKSAEDAKSPLSQQLTQRPVAISDDASALALQSDRAPKTSEAAGPLGLSTAQNMIEGRTLVGLTATLNVISKVKPAGVSSPVEDGFIQSPSPQTAHKGIATNQAEIMPALANSAPAAGHTVKALDSAERSREQQPIDRKHSATKTQIATSSLPLAGQLIPTAPSITTQTSIQAVMIAQQEIENKLSERDFTIGSIASDRPISTTGQIAQTAQPEVARSVVQQLSIAVAQSTQATTEITLNPEELGRVRLTLSVGDGSLTLSVIAERPETQELLRRNIEMLAQEFRALGYQDLAFAFGDDGAATQSENSDSKDHDGTILQPELDARTETGANDTTSGLDLRL